MDSLVNARQYKGDFFSRLWVPYIGLQVSGNQYRGSLLWGPYAKGSVGVRFALYSFNEQAARILTLWPIFFQGDVSLSSTIFAEHRFDTLAPGVFVEGRAEYDWTLFPRCVVTLWCEGAWTGLKGNTQVRFVQSTQDRLFLSILGPVPFLGFVLDQTIVNASSDSMDTDGFFRRFSYGGGLTVTLRF